VLAADWTVTLKARWMKVGDGTVEALMKDIQVDASSFPAFRSSNWESIGCPDIAEKSAHVTCPASIIETAKMYNPNMKVEILAIPPRVSKDHVLLPMAAVHAWRIRPGIRPVPHRRGGICRVSRCSGRVIGRHLGAGQGPLSQPRLDAGARRNRIRRTAASALGLGKP
jgi:hypothetical protein